MRDFLSLYPLRTRRAFAWAVVGSALLAVLDFAALLLLLPVFGALAGGVGPGAAGAPPTGFAARLWELADPSAMVVGAMALLIARSAAGFAFKVWWSTRVSSAEVALSSRLLGAYAFAPYVFHLRSNSADLLSRAVSHVNIASNAGLNGMVNVAGDATTVLALVAALFVANPAAAAVVCLYLAVVSGLFVGLSRRFAIRQSETLASEIEHVYRRVTTVLRGIRELTVAGGRDTALESVRRSRERMVRAQRNMLVLADVPRLTLEVALYAAVLLALLVVLARPGGSAALPLIALYVVAALRMLPAISRGLGNLTQVRAGMQMGANVRAELQGTGAPVEPAESAEGFPRKGELVLDGVGFSYPGGPAVLTDVSLRIPFGTFVAVVGPSGAGKSTLLNLILGLLAPSAGSVTYAGRPVSSADARWLAHVAYVPQEVFVLDDTVLANVALGDPRPHLDRVWRALESASVADAVRQMADGLDTRLGESGARISVGQRQRLGIARALYRDPAVLVMDEPTSALDDKTEAGVIDTMNTLRGQVTMIVVAHRPASVAMADRVVRISSGTLSGDRDDAVAAREQSSTE